MGQANGGNEDAPYAAAVKIVKAATTHAMVVDSDEYVDTPVGHIVVPMIVLGGHLFETYLDAQGNLAVDEVTSGILDWKNPVAGRSPAWIRCVTQQDLPRAVEDLRTTADRLETALADVAQQMSNRWREEFDRRHTAG
jgi:hypothetical protein